MNRLMLTLVLAVSTAQAPAPWIAVTATGPKVVLKAATDASALPPEAQRSFSLELANFTDKQIAIAKPMFPSAWVVKRRYWDGAAWQIKENSGGAGRGHPSAGYPNRYRTEDYLILKPSEVYRITDDLNWYLAFPESEVLPGSYEVTFFYRYEPSRDESDLPLLTKRLESNTIKVEVSGDK